MGADTRCRSTTRGVAEPKGDRSAWGVAPQPSGSMNSGLGTACGAHTPPGSYSTVSTTPRLSGNRWKTLW